MSPKRECGPSSMENTAFARVCLLLMVYSEYLRVLKVVVLVLLGHVQYATAVKKLLFWLRLGAYSPPDLSINTSIQFLILRTDAEHQILNIQILILQRSTMRDVFLRMLQTDINYHTGLHPSMMMKTNIKILNERLEDCRHQRSSCCPLSTTP